MWYIPSSSADPVKIMQRRNHSLLRIVLICCTIAVTVYLVYMHYVLRQHTKDKDLKLEWSKRAKDTLTSKLQDMAAEKDQQDRKFQSDKEELMSRFSALQRTFKLAQTSLEDTQGKYARLDAEFNKLKLQHEEEEENYRRELTSFKQEKELEISSLKDSLANINNQHNQQAMDLSTCQEANSQLRQANALLLQNQDVLKNQADALQKQLQSIGQQQNRQQAALQPQVPGANDDAVKRPFDQAGLPAGDKQDALDRINRLNKLDPETLRRIEEQHQMQPPNRDEAKPIHYEHQEPNNEIKAADKFHIPANVDDFNDAAERRESHDTLRRAHGRNNGVNVQNIDNSNKAAEANNEGFKNKHPGFEDHPAVLSQKKRGYEEYRDVGDDDVADDKSRGGL